MTDAVHARLRTLGLTLPQPMQTANLPFELAIESAIVLPLRHVPIDADGRLTRTVGKVGAEVSPDQAFEAARQVALAMLTSIDRALGGFSRVRRWLRVFGMVNAAPGFNALPGVINGCSELILDVFGPDVGRHARSAVGMATLPFEVPVEIEAELEIEARS